MSGTSLSSAELDPRRKRALWRAWHRGTREMDLLLGGYCDAALGAMSDADLDALEALMEEPDRELYAWLTDAEATPERADTPLFRGIKAFHRARPR